MDDTLFAPPQKPWNASIPLQIPTTVVVSTMVSFRGAVSGFRIRPQYHTRSSHEGPRWISLSLDAVNGSMVIRSPGPILAPGTILPRERSQ